MISKVRQWVEQVPLSGPAAFLSNSRHLLGCLNRARPSGPAACRIAALLLVLGVWSSPLSAVNPVVQGASLGPETMYVQGNGDTWYATWADDGDLYVTSDDTTGFSGNCTSKGLGSFVYVALSRLHGDDPTHFTGETVNCLEAYSVPPDPKHDTSWKTTGITSIDGTLYLVVEQDTYEDAANLGKETARNATIVKSTDHGKTWSGSEADSVAHPMFPGTRFGTPSFIQYGRDGAGGVDGGEDYVYAISNEGSWDNSNSIVLGRVRRSDLPRLRGEDWEFYANGRWTHELGESQPILREPNHLASSSGMYVPALHKYMLASWYYPNCTGYAVPACDVHRTRWVWYEAAKPWGPWTKFWESEWFPQGYYNPILVNKFLSPDGTSGWVSQQVIFGIAPGIILSLRRSCLILHRAPSSMTPIRRPSRTRAGGVPPKPAWVSTAEICITRTTPQRRPHSTSKALECGCSQISQKTWLRWRFISTAACKARPRPITIQPRITPSSHNASYGAHRALRREHTHFSCASGTESIWSWMPSWSRAIRD